MKINRRHFALQIPVAAVGTSLLAPVLVAKAQDSATPSASPADTVGPAIPSEVTEFANDWPVWHGNLAATRAAQNSTITAENAASLEVIWRYALTGSGPYGAIVAPVLIAGDVVYAQDSASNVYAIDRESGDLIWKAEIEETNVGPNGLALGYGMIFGPTGYSGGAFALNAETGEEIWRTTIAGIELEYTFGAPAVRDNTVYFGTMSGYDGRGHGALYALDAATGELKWAFNTVADNAWGNPALNSGAGIWYQSSFDEDGNVYFGTGNPGPTPGTAEYPNATSRPGANLYSSSMVSLDPETGAVRWYYQDRPHDIIDHDFQNTPILAKVDVYGEEREFAIGSGKTGNVAAVDAVTGQLIWKIPVGTHNAYGDGLELPEDGSEIQAYPGLYGGVEFGGAYEDNILYLGVVEMPSGFSANGAFDEAASDYNAATGLLYAIEASNGQILWTVDLPQLPFGGVTKANDVLFVPLMNGTFNAYSAADGTLLFNDQAGAGFAAPASISGDIVIGAAGGILFGDYPEGIERATEIIAYRVATA